MQKWNLIIYAPAYNVEPSVSDLMPRVSKAAERLRKSEIFLKSMIIIDDGSTDNTRQVLQSTRRKYPWLRIAGKDRNEGAMKALFDGMELALSAMKEQKLQPSRTIFVRMDTDLEHQPEDLEKLLEPILSGKSKLSVGYIPFDSRSGIGMKLFNEKIGLSESRKFIGKDIPQFCPGFNAIRADFFAKLHPLLVQKAEEFKRKNGIDMLTIDFVILALARMQGEEVRVLKLSPIENRWVKKIPAGKLWHYYKCHRKTMDFLKHQN